MNDSIKILKKFYIEKIFIEKLNKKLKYFFYYGHVILLFINVYMWFYQDKKINNLIISNVVIYTLFLILFKLIENNIKSRHNIRRQDLYKYFYLKLKILNNEDIKKILIDNYYTKNNDYCLICTLNKNNVKLQCNHLYCSNCLSEWIKKENNCPICRSLIIDNEQMNYIIELINK